MRGKRQSTVEPVFGTLTQFMGMRKVNTLGIKQGNADGRSGLQYQEVSEIYHEPSQYHGQRGTIGSFILH